MEKINKIIAIIVEYFIIIGYNISMNDVRHGRGYVYSIKYHIVWCVKYRRKVITIDVEKTLEQLLNKIAKDNKVKIIEFNTDLDHVHLLIEATPQTYLPNIIKAFKGVTARLLFKQYGSKLKSKLYGGHLWNPSYFVATVSENTKEQIKQYIKSQKEG